jgi:protoporphyrin/coproporphyrin ferrochelatase
MSRSTAFRSGFVRDAGDPYATQCEASFAKAIAEALGNRPSRSALMTYQSRFGREPWLQPYTDQTLQKLARRGHATSVDVVCPGFAVDCLETLEEIEAAERGAVSTRRAGRTLRYIPGAQRQTRSTRACWRGSPAARLTRGDGST